ncbi:subunit RPB3 of DNA-directed RNA polymerase II [Pseudoloma neurophilia]|uniref:Subunit RPB3 of DNA-directed RNA polymerase II n=1 Tax=Pseudoloma neurophilia TaxID=146866 RepID=A0A0R0LZY9_9MICR|nr:subunit RPB3 of DNA-directed RNA polymerase II [Pseudoloma neurophilia]
MQQNLSLEIHSFSQSNHSVTVHGCTVPLLNTLRRCLLMDVPSLSLDLITIENNSSNMPNEMLCHRLGMIQLPFVKLKNDCDCMITCKDCSLTVYLDKKGMSDVNGNDLHCESLDTSCLKGLIVKLADKQSIKLKGIAKNGIAKEHSKFQAVNLVSFIKVNDQYKGLKIELADHREIHEILEWAIETFLTKIRRLQREIENVSGDL